MKLLDTLKKYKNETLIHYYNGLNKQSLQNYVKGSIRTCEAATLYSIIREYKFKNIIDIGTGEGFSALYLAQACKDNNAGKVTTFDITDKPTAKAMIAHFGLSDYVEFVLGNSSEMIPIKMKAQTIDFVLIDGEHSAKQTRADFECVYHQLAPGGCVAFHDVYPRPENSPGSRNFVNEITSDMGEVIFFDESIFNYFSYNEDIADVNRIAAKWKQYNYSYVSPSANPKELMAVFFKK